MSFDLMFQTIDEMITAVTIAVPKVAVAIVVFFAFVIVGRGIQWTFRRAIWRRRRRHNLGLVIGRLAHWAVVLVGLFVALSIVLPTLRAGDLVQLLGIGGVAIGFAFRDIFQNFLAGILLLLTEPFRIGDQIVVGEFEGTVDGIETRATTIVTYDGRRVVIPNANLFTRPVIVNTAYDRRRIEVEVGVGYEDDLDRVKAVVLSALADSGGILKDPAPDVIVVRLGEFGVVIRARWWIEPPRRADALDTRDAVLAAIKKRLEEEGFETPYPTHRVLLRDRETGTDRA